MEDLSNNLEIPSKENFEEAKKFLEGRINRTPLFYSSTFSRMFSSSIYFKMENLQKTGSFKARGALFRTSKLTEDERKRGVITASAGNHAQGVAYSAMLNGISAKIVMPEFSNPSKINAVREYKAEAILHGYGYAEAYELANKIAEDENRVFIEAFNDRWIISGQGTVALEILEDNPDIDTIVVPIGGGGLISGIAMAAKLVKPTVRIVGVQSDKADSMKKSVEAGRVVSHNIGPSIADGITVKSPSELTYRIVSQYVDEIVTVSEESIAHAVFKLLERNKTLVEPAGAASLAAVMEGKVDVENRKVAIVLSGGNMNFLLLSKIIYKSLELEAKLIRIEFKIPDRPGTLHRISGVISETGGNIYHAEVDNLAKDTPVGFQNVTFTVNVSGEKQLNELLEKLNSLGYSYEITN